MVIVYAITCAATDMAYIGSTAGKLNKRMREHRRLLNGGIHTCIALQSDWAKLGPSHFQSHVLEVVHVKNLDVETKRETELRWMGFYRDNGMLYNAEADEKRRQAGELQMMR